MSTAEISALFEAWKKSEFEGDGVCFIELLKTEEEVDMVRSWRMVYDYGFNTGYSCAEKDGYRSA